MPVEVVVPAYVDGRGDLRVGVDRLAGRGVGLHGATGSGGGFDAGTERLEEAHAPRASAGRRLRSRGSARVRCRLLAC